MCVYICVYVFVHGNNNEKWSSNSSILFVVDYKIVCKQDKNKRNVKILTSLMVLPVITI